MTLACPAGAPWHGWRAAGNFAERSPSGLWRRTGNAVRGNPSRVRIPPSPPHARLVGWPIPALAVPLPRSRTSGCARPGARDRLGPDATTRRANEYRYTPGCRARRGTSGALYLQSAPAGLNSPSRPPRAEAATPGDVEDRVPRSGDSRTVSGPEGSSTQRISPGAADRPGPSRLRWWARARAGRQGVHGAFANAAPEHDRDRRGSPGAP